MYQPVRLAGSQGDGRHPYVDATGAFIGRGVALLEAAPDAIGHPRFRPRPIAHLNVLLDKGYGVCFDCARLERHLRAVAGALNEGNLARAAIALVHAKLPPLPDEAATGRLAKADRELRERIAKWREERVAVVDASGLIKYSTDQPRDYHGRWVSANAETGPEGYGPPLRTGESGPRFTTSSQVDRDRELHPWKARPNPEFRSYVAEQEQSTTHSPGTDGYGEIGRDDKGQPVAFGRYQLRRGALQDIGWLDEHGNWTPVARKHGINGLQEFLTNREAQEEAFDLYLGRTQFALKHREIDLRTRGDEEFVSLWTLVDRNIAYTGIAGEPITVTQSGLVAAAHREGDSNVRKYFRFLDSHHWHVTDADYEQLGSTGTIFRIIETRLRSSQHVPYDPVPDVPPPSRTRR